MKKVAITGPESTGKSLLAEGLAKHYQTTWVPEFAREYMCKLDGAYTLSDVEEIARGQLLLEEEALQNARNILFSDTELTNIKIWVETKFNNVPAWIEEEWRNQDYDLYLLTYPDLPWESDPLRENPGKGEYFFNRFKYELDSRNFPCFVVRGRGNERLKNAINAVDKLV